MSPSSIDNACRGERDIVRCPKPTKRKKNSRKQSTLDSLWSAVVHAQWHETCGYLGVLGHICQGRLGAHHIVRRSVGVLRHEPMNGILLCDGIHDKARLQKVELAIWLLIGAKARAYIIEHEDILLKDWLKKLDMTREEYRLHTAAKLNRML